MCGGIVLAGMSTRDTTARTDKSVMTFSVELSARTHTQTKY